MQMWMTNMADNFEWQTEEDEALWEEVSPQPASPSPPESRRRWWLGLLALGLLVVAGVVVYRQMQQQVNSALSQVEEDVLSSHRLVVTAVTQQDVDVLRILLSGRDSRWVAAQETAVANNAFYGRDALGLRWEPASHMVISTTVAPDLESVELTAANEYVAAQADGSQKRVTLWQTAVYRRGAQRWLLSPPESDFWGDWDSIEKDRLTLVFPGRDAEIAEQIYPVLVDALARACTELADISCAADFRMTLRLEKDAQALANLGNPAAIYRQGLRLELPAPTLVGVPVDDAGVQALANGYAAHLAAAVITNEVGWRCCSHAPVYQALIDYQLGQLGLRAWQIADDDHVQLWQSAQNVSLENMFGWWATQAFGELDEAERRQLYAAVDFLLREETAVSPAQMQRLMNVSGMSFLRWMRDLFAVQDRRGSVQIIEQLNAEWRRYAMVRASIRLSESGPPIPLPEQDLQMVCVREAFDGPQMELFRYRLAAGEWQSEWQSKQFNLVFPHPQDEGMFLHALSFSDEELSSMRRWHNGVTQTLAVEPRYAVTLGQFDAQGRYLSLYKMLLEDEMAGDQPQFQIDLIDTEDCAADECRRYPVPGAPVWSPDGRSVLMNDAAFVNQPIFTGDNRVWLLGDETPAPHDIYVGSLEAALAGESLQRISGYAPFWVDDQTYGYVREMSDGEDAVVLAAIDDVQPQVVLSYADMATLLSAETSAPAARLVVRYVIGRPGHPQQLFVVVSDEAGQRAYLLLLDLDSGALTLHLDLGFLFAHVLGFSPDGRYLTVTKYGSISPFSGRDAVDNVIVLQDIDAGSAIELLFDGPEVFPPFVFDWSLDGRWLVVTLDDGLLQLVAPEFDYRRLIEYNSGGCDGTVAWIQR